jgi:ATP-dependent DNA helicase RecQ
MALSGVARVRGRFGKNVVAQMLTGSTSEKISRRGLDRLSTHGLLKEYTQPEVVLLLDYLLAVGCIEQEEIDRFRPVVKLTPLGHEVMSGRREPPAGGRPPTELFARLDRNQPSSTVQPPAQPDLVGRLYEARRKWAEQENVPAYRIAPNSTLDELARLKPQTREELLKVKGIGPSTVERYGDRWIELLGRTGDVHTEAASDSSKGRPSTDLNKETAPSSRPSYYWTWLLMDRGFTVDEIAAIRGMDSGAVYQEASLASRNGYRMRSESIPKQ